MIRRLMVLFAAMALTSAVACSGGETKDDAAPTEQTETAPMEEEEPAEEADEALEEPAEEMDEAAEEVEEEMPEEEESGE